MAMGDTLFKAVLVGDSSVGKTSLFQRLEDDTFNSARSSPTIGGSYNRLKLHSDDGSDVEVGLWDTAGQERFRTIVPIYFHRADVVACVFDLSQQSSFHSVRSWIDLAARNAPEGVRFILIGNKLDLVGTRAVDATEAEDLANSIRADGYIETSAESGEGIADLKRKIASIVGSLARQKGPALPPENKEGTAGSCCAGVLLKKMI
jgi:small GTP-binding protein